MSEVSLSLGRGTKPRSQRCSWQQHSCPLRRRCRCVELTSVCACKQTLHRLQGACLRPASRLPTQSRAWLQAGRQRACGAAQAAASLGMLQLSVA